MEHIKTYLKKIKPNHILSVIAAGSVLFVAMNSNNPPLFQNTDNFILFASGEIKLEQGVQVSSGDLGSNDKIDIAKDSIINGNLFADKISLDKNTQINGNVSYNKLQTQKESQILGAKTTPVSLPIANLPEIPDFSIGTQDFKFESQNNALAVGSYRNITLEKDSRLNLNGGTYNLNKLELKENSTLIFNTPATINIQFKLKGQNHIAILTGNNNLKPTDLVINYLGIRSKNEKEEKEDDDDEINAPHNDKEKKEFKESKIGRPVVFGKESFLNFKLLAPKASVKIGENSTMRGQILARKVKVEKNSILSLEQTAIKITKPENIIIDPDGGVYPINILLISLIPNATFEDALKVAQSINGRIVGNVSSINLYQIEIQTRTIEELESIINTVRLRTDLKIDGVFRDYLLPIDI